MEFSGRILGGPVPTCPPNEQCLDWAHRYLGDCVCNYRDGISFALGLASVAAWGVAEIPQIIANFSAGSTEGISVAFLITWVIGDIFNLIGCYLEPATLPTQFYMAGLYTITTLILTAQSIYYEFLSKRSGKAPDEMGPLLEAEESAEPARQRTAVATEVISVPLSRKTSSKDVFIASARSLASSFTPTMGSFVPHASHVGSLLSQSPGPGLPHMPHVLEPGGRPQSRRNSISRMVALSTLLLGTAHLHSRGRAFAAGNSAHAEPGVWSHGIGRRILQVGAPSAMAGPLGSGGRTAGEIMGWCMAAIYMGGRLPQIWLNIQRGTVEGLSPLMFLFALLGNVTYVASILARSVAWSKISPNLPWLVDAGVCAILDILILSQFVYFSYNESDDEDLADYDALK